MCVAIVTNRVKIRKIESLTHEYIEPWEVNFAPQMQQCLGHGSQTRGPPDVFVRSAVSSKFLELLLKLLHYFFEAWKNRDLNRNVVHILGQVLTKAFHERPTFRVERMKMRTKCRGQEVMLHGNSIKNIFQPDVTPTDQFLLYDLNQSDKV